MCLKELTGSFEDFKDLVPKASDRLKIKKCIRTDFGYIIDDSSRTSSTLSSPNMSISNDSSMNDPPSTVTVTPITMSSRKRAEVSTSRPSE